MDEDINYDNVKMDMSEDSDSDRRSASSYESSGRKSSRYSRSSRSSMSRSDDSSSRSEDEDRSSRARSEAHSPGSVPEKFDSNGRKQLKVQCSSAIGKDEQERDENHSMSPHTEKRLLSLSPRDRLSTSDSSSDSSDDSDEYYRKKRLGSNHTDEESKLQQLTNLRRGGSRSPFERSQPSSPREKSVDHSSSPYEKGTKCSRSPSNKDGGKKSSSPSSSKTKGARSPLSGKQRQSRSPIEHKTQYSRSSPDRIRRHHSGAYTDRRKSPRSPERKIQRLSPTRKSTKRSDSPSDNRKRKSSSPSDAKRKSNVLHDRNQNRKSYSPRDTKRNRSRSPYSKDKRSASSERSVNKLAKHPDGQFNEKNVRSTSPRQSKQLESPKRDDTDQLKSHSSRDKFVKRRSCSSSDEEAQKKAHSSASRDKKDRKHSPLFVKEETTRKGERDHRRSPGDRSHSRSRSRSHRNSRHKHCSPIEDPVKSSQRWRGPLSHHRRSRPRSRSRGRDDGKPRHRRAFDKKPSKLSILEKLGIDFRPSASGPAVTPQQLLQQSIELQKQQVKSSTGIELPSYYNPAAVNPARYAEQIQKRRLLWGNKGKEPDKKPEAVIEEMPPPAATEATSSASNNQWEATTFAQDQDGKMTAKFKRLMGMKETAASNPATTGVDSNTLLQKQEELFTSMEMQYEVARLATHTQRGVGLGYGTFQYPR